MKKNQAVHLSKTLTVEFYGNGGAVLTDTDDGSEFTLAADELQALAALLNQRTLQARMALAMADDFAPVGA